VEIDELAVILWFFQNILSPSLLRLNKWLKQKREIDFVVFFDGTKVVF